MPFANPRAMLLDKLGQPVSLVTPLQLHVGGQQSRAGWFNVNSIDSDAVDLVADCSDLSMIPNSSCGTIYCSPVIEHLSHNGQLHKTLRGFRRILRNAGKILISVPDLDVLCRLFLRQDLDIGQRHFVMAMIFGGQVSEFDFHKAGFNLALLKVSLVDAGFNRIERVDSFGLFNDTSEKVILGESISLNVIASA